MSQSAAQTIAVGNETAIADIADNERWGSSTALSGAPSWFRHAICGRGRTMHHNVGADIRYVEVVPSGGDGDVQTMQMTIQMTL